MVVETRARGQQTDLDPRLTQGRWLRIPGPTPLHPAVVEALPHEMIPHRGVEMTELFERLFANAKAVHRTGDNVLFWPGTGSSGWEAGIVNLLSPGDQVVATVCGDFGDRFAALGARFGLNVDRVEVEWGEAVTPDLLREAIARHDRVKAVFVTHNETSTGVTNPLKDLAAVARDADALVLVDAVSSAAALPLEVDAWGLDWVLSGAQKAWMCPPGLMIAAVSDRALEAAESAGYPRFIWDVRAMVKSAADNTTQTTAPLTMLFAFDAALKAILDEGVEQVWARHQRLGDHVRARIADLGLTLLADPAYASNSITAFEPPTGVSAGEFRDRLRAASGIEIAVGQGKRATDLNRLGHMGWVEQPELDATIEALAKVV